MKKLYIISIVSVFLTSCATAPATYSVSKNRSYDKTYDQVWESIVSHFASNNIQIKNIAKDSGVIYAERMGFDSSVADCGKPGILAVTGRQANFNVFVNRSGVKPAVSVNTEFLETRRFDASVTTVSCNSTGVLETNILNAAGQ